MVLEISDDDVLFAERLMGIEFKLEQRTAIKSLGTRDIVACPGSGKTTALVAKLAILAHRGVSGICVLSHTNVAKTEIERKLGKWSSTVCAYPNFVGTFQSFVHTFLATPAAVAKYRLRPQGIDDDLFDSLASMRYKTIPWGLRAGLDQTRGGRGLEFVQSLRLDPTNLDEICYENSGKLHSIKMGPTTPTYQALNRLKQELAQEGYFAYRDAYSLAQWYVTSFAPSIKSLLTKRFQWVFIDEMQDTDPLQAALIEALFGTSQVQRYGDPNQSIFRIQDSDSDLVWNIEAKPIQLNESTRLSPSIASLSENAGLYPQKLVGNPTRPARRHTIFLFEHGAISSVLTAYANLISEEGLDLTNGDFVAVGAWKTPTGDPAKYRIQDYWPDFDLKSGSKLVVHDSLADYVVHASEILRKTGSAGDARKVVMSGLIRLLRIERVVHPDTKRPFTEASYARFLKTQHPDSYSKLATHLAALCLRLRSNDEWSKEDVQPVLEAALAPLLKGFSPKGLEYIAGNPTESSLLKQGDGRGLNVVSLQSPRGQVNTRIATIHSVKGETHTSTLVLETSNAGFDLQTILPFLIGDGKRPVKLKRTRRAMALDYVAMTRPTELLCLAMLQDHVSEEQIKLLETKGWTVQRVVNSPA